MEEKIEDTIDIIINQIKDKECLVILGPELLCEGKGSINSCLNKNLVEKYGDEVIYYPDDEFLKITKKVQFRILDDIKKFYNQLQPTEVYRQIAEIPFPLIINTAPDTTLNKIFEEKGIDFDYGYYQKNEAPKEVARKNKTFIYNIFGDYHHFNSLILTYDDLFEYLFSIMGDYELKIKSELRNATSVLFFGFNFDKWYFKLLLRLMIQIDKNKELSSHDIDPGPIKSFYADEFNVKFFKGETVAEIVKKIHQKAKEAGMIQEPEKKEQVQSELFISYAWGGESEKVAKKIYDLLYEKGYKIILDKIDLAYKGNIRQFMQNIGKGKYVVVVISDEYIKSENCMFEILEIKQKGDLYDRIFPVVLSDALIYDEIDRIDYLNYWDYKIHKLKEKYKTVIDPVGTDKIIEKINLYNDIRRIVDVITDMLRNMNTMTPAMHNDTNFEALINAIDMKIKTDSTTSL